MDRQLKAVLLNRLESDRAVAILGPRQTGKSYILEEIIKQYGGKYLSLDDPSLRAEIVADPLNYLRRIYVKGSFLFIDEAAKAPPIFDAVKILIDEAGSSPTGICLANSGNYLLMKRIKESLAGRISFLSLYPCSWQELNNKNDLPEIIKILQKDEIQQRQPLKSFTEIDRERNERLLWGGYPVPALSQNMDAKNRWAVDYFKTYVFPILIEQFNIRNLEAFEKCARLTFIHSGRVLNYNRIATETGITQPTASGYIHQLKAMMLIVLLETYFNNPRKRLLKQPKLHVVDPLLLHSALGTNFNLQAAKERSLFGHIYESFIVFELIKALENKGLSYQMFSWRTADKAEVDVIIESNGEIIPIEIKASENLTNKDLSGLKAFFADNKRVTQGFVVFPGKEAKKISDRITAVPDWQMLGTA